MSELDMSWDERPNGRIAIHREGVGVDIFGSPIPELVHEIERLRVIEDRVENHPWETLLEILDRVYPESVFPTTRSTDEPGRDQGPRIVAMTRWVNELRGDLREALSLLQASTLDPQHKQPPGLLNGGGYVLRRTDLLKKHGKETP